MKKRLLSFSVLLPIADLLVAAALVLVPALLFFFRLKHTAHGSGHVVESFFSFAFFRAAAAAEKAIAVLNAPAHFVDLNVSLLTSRTTAWTSYSTSRWYPAWLGLWPGRSLTYPIYALPAWFYVGRGVDALLGRRGVRTGNMVFSLMLAVVAIVICFSLRFGLSSEERKDDVNLYIEGFALWACLFAIPFAAWFRQKAAGTSS